ncbi:Protein FAM117B [Triplophysa tibetana]|uniref:Protein FAM117B n=1 Tax=Triplophysa tibetana TaxID=1572043 RepID=A0A5A9P2Q1_9TELE|nr:Protein FAM117B [Triplophysa tibetana]
MSQRARRNGSPTSNVSCSGVTTGSPTGTAGICAVGAGLLGRLLPMKATVPFQLKSHTQHPLQIRTVLSTGNGKCLSSGYDPHGTHSRSPTRSLSSSSASNISPVTFTSSAMCQQCITSTVASSSHSSSRTSPVISVHATNTRAHAQVLVPYTGVHVTQCCSSSQVSSDSASLTSHLSASPSSSWSCGHRVKSQQPPEHDRLSPESQSPGSPVWRDKPRFPVAGSWYTTNSNGSIRRTSSLDALTAPYLSGHWPRDPSHSPCAPCMRDKSTQTPSALADECGQKKRGCHKRSASCGSTDQLKEIVKLRQQLQRSKHSSRHHRDKDRKSPFNGNHTAISQPQATIPKSVLISIPISKSSVSRFRNSVEGLNQEIERIIIRDTGNREELFIPQEAPDGHRAPPPLFQRSASSRSIDTQTPLDSAADSSHSNSSSRSQSISPTFLNIPSEPCSDSPSPNEDEPLTDGHEKDLAPGSPQLKYASSPKPNNSYMFKREPPEGCERVKVFTEETQARPQQGIPQFLCPDRNKVNFVPKSGSAFCAVSIAKPPITAQELNNLKNQSNSHLVPEPEQRASWRTCLPSQQPSGSSSCLSELDIPTQQAS